MQLKFEDGLELYSADKANNKTHSLTDQNTIKKMETSSRFPIPESLLNCPSGYWLKIDSLIHNIYNTETLAQTATIPPQLKAPANSDVSADNLSIGSDTPEEEQAPQIQPEFEDPNKPKPFDKKLVLLQPFNLEKIMIFPHKARDGEIPIRLFNTPKIDYLTIVSNTIAKQQQEDEKYQYSLDKVVAICEHYCHFFKV